LADHAQQSGRSETETGPFAQPREPRDFHVIRQSANAEALLLRVPAIEFKIRADLDDVRARWEAGPFLRDVNVGKGQSGDRFIAKAIEPLGRLFELAADGGGLLQGRECLEALAGPVAIADAMGPADERFRFAQAALALGGFRIAASHVSAIALG